MNSPFLAEIRLISFNFAPRGWAFCNGQILQISQAQALFALLGTTYGGNGITTFALPDLRGRVPMHAGQGGGLSNRTLGQQIGEEAHSLAQTEMPAHSHLPACSGAAQNNVQQPANDFWATDSANVFQGYAATPDAQMSDAAIAASGGGQLHANLQPYLVLNAIIALTGIFPSRN